MKNISDDINDFEYEITNHKSTPPYVNNQIINLRKTLEAAQAIRRRLWRHWIKEYLVNNNFSWKWNNYSKNLERGAILSLKYVNSSWLQWSLARISTISPGRGNIVSIVELKTVVLVQLLRKMYWLERADYIHYLSFLFWDGWLFLLNSNMKHLAFKWINSYYIFKVSLLKFQYFDFKIIINNNILHTYCIWWCLMNYMQGSNYCIKVTSAKKSKISQTFDISVFYVMFCFVVSLFSQIYFAKV